MTVQGTSIRRNCCVRLHAVRFRKWLPWLPVNSTISLKLRASNPNTCSFYGNSPRHLGERSGQLHMLSYWDRNISVQILYIMLWLFPVFRGYWWTHELIEGSTKKKKFIALKHVYITIYKIDNQCASDAWSRAPKASAPWQPGRIGWGGRWGAAFRMEWTHVYLWPVHVDV